MPPGSSSFPASDSSNQEVTCPLRNQDGSQCRKRCLGEKRYRSMQEHIRRAHPEYYIPKLPATKESFQLMITSTPHERPAPDPNQPQHNHSNSNSNNHIAHSHHLSHSHHHHHHHHQPSDPSGLSPTFILDAGLSSSYQGYPALGAHDGGYYSNGDPEAAAIYSSMQAQQRSSDEYRRGSLIPAVSAAAALAQLHYQRPDSDWDGDNIGQNYYADTQDVKASFEVDPALDDADFMTDPAGFPASAATDAPDLLPSSLSKSSPDRSLTLPSLPRNFARTGFQSRPRKSSLSQQARLAKHQRKKSRELIKRISGERRAFANDSSPGGLLGKQQRWEELLDAAQSATEEEGSRDLTPVPASPYQSPPVGGRSSMQTFLGSQFQSYQASPLNRALTPPNASDTSGLDLQTFPSVDSSLSSSLSHHQHHDSTGSGSQFQIMNPSSIDPSSPIFTPATNNGSLSPVQIYCAGCRRLSVLKDSFACTNCICGLCSNCMQAIVEEQGRGRMSMCPRCHALNSSFKQFQLDLR